MTFEEQAAELHDLDALARSLGLSDAEFVRIATAAIEEAHAERAGPNGPLMKIRQRLVEYGRCPATVTDLAIRTDQEMVSS